MDGQERAGGAEDPRVESGRGRGAARPEDRRGGSVDAGRDFGGPIDRGSRDLGSGSPVDLGRGSRDLGRGSRVDVEPVRAGTPGRGGGSAVERGDGGSRVDVEPVRAGGRVPRSALAGGAIAVLAFVAGLAVASSGPVPPPLPPGGLASDPAPGSPGIRPGVEAAAPSEAAPTPRAAGTRPPPPGSSAFLAGFDPGALIASIPGADRCRTGQPRDKEVPRTRRDGPRMTFQRSWIAWCPMAGSERQAFLLGLFDRLVDAVPAATFGYNASLRGAGDALFPYAERPLAGSVSVTADDAGRGIAVAIVATEWRLDEAP